MGKMVKILSIFSICISFIASHAQVNMSDPLLIETNSGLKYKITKQGSGSLPKPGDRVWVHYYTILNNDSLIEASVDREPLDVYLGQGQLIKGWEEGLQLVKTGGSILLIIPPQLGYGMHGYKNIPPNATLISEINLIQVNQGKAIEPFNIANLNASKTPEGIQYYIIDEGTGNYAVNDDNAYIHYSGFLPNGLLFDSSLKKGKPVRITVGINQLFEGLDIALKLMKSGSKMHFEIPSALAYGIEGLGNIIPPNTNISLDIEMLDLKTPPIISKWNSSGKTINQTSSGLKYIIFNTGEGDLITDENIVEVHYSGYFTNGKLFDSSLKRYETIQFPIGVNAVIDGWDEGLKLMRKGAKYQLLVPSKLAYGDEGAPPQIPANTDLTFDIEVIDVIK